MTCSELNDILHDRAPLTRGAMAAALAHRQVCPACDAMVRRYSDQFSREQPELEAAAEAAARQMFEAIMDHDDEALDVIGKSRGLTAEEIQEARDRWRKR